ncbi:MAG: histidine kinase N-terminal 7TM domain-containing protein, partial [Candidatus Omnitrophota bacterium]
MFINTLFTVSGLFLSLTCFVLLFVLLKFGTTRVHRTWAAFNLSVAIWGLGLFFVGRAGNQETALRAWQFAHIGGVSIAVTFFHLVYTLCELKYKKFLFFAYFQNIVFVLLSIFNPANLYIKGTFFIFGSIHYAKPETFLYALSMVIWVGLILLGLYELMKFYRKASVVKKKQVLYLLLGTAIGFSGGVTYFLPMYGIIIFPLGNFTVPIYTVLSTYAILRHRLLDVRVTFTRAGIFLALYTAVLGLPFYIGVKTASWKLSTSFAVIFASIGPIAYRILQRKADDLLLAKQRHYQKILIQAAGGMTREHNLGRLLQLIVYIVKKAVKLTFAAIFTHDPEKKIYKVRAVRNRRIISEEISFNEDHALIQYIKDNPDPFTAEEMPQLMRE